MLTSSLLHIYDPPDKPWVPEIGYVLHLPDARRTELESELIGGICSVRIPKLPDSARRQPMLGLIGFSRGKLTHVARAQVRYRAETGADRFDIWTLEALPRPVSVASVRRELPLRRAARADVALKKGGFLPPAALRLALTALEKADAAARATASSLERPRGRIVPDEESPAQIIWAYQRDAAVTALDIAGIPRRELGISPQFAGAAKADTTSIFDDVGVMTTIEDVVVLRDLDGDPMWERIKTHRYPARTFLNGTTKLTLVLANKLPLEQLLGADLIYINETLMSIVFVQYKMFKGKYGEGGFRPDDQLADEIRRMDAAIQAFATLQPDDTCDGYRLGEEAFFLKFCSKVLEHDQDGHVPGHYLPLNYFKRLMLDPRVRGPRGGTVFRPDNLGRYMTPTFFKELVSRGWVGTYLAATAAVVEHIKAAMEGRRTVVLAVQSKEREAASDEGESLPVPRGE